jgi:hypothetical protein
MAGVTALEGAGGVATGDADVTAETGRVPEDGVPPAWVADGSAARAPESWALSIEPTN